MLWQEILSAIYEFLINDKKEEGHFANSGAKNLFNFLKSKFNSEIYKIFFENIVEEFFQKVPFIEDEPYERGRTEAIYFISRSIECRTRD